MASVMGPPTEPPNLEDLDEKNLSGTYPDRLMDQEWAQDLLTVIDHFDKADQSVRERQMRRWRKHLWYWDSIQYLWWSEVARDWRTPEQAYEEFDGANQVNIDPTLYAKVINIYRAHGEVVIAAMSASVPKVTFPPDDADNPDDVLTSKAYTKLAEVVYRHNYAEILLIKALFILYNQGLVCAYNDNFQSTAYGVTDVPIQGEVGVRNREYVCPNCGNMLGQEQFDLGPLDAPSPLEQIPEPEGAQEDLDGPGPNVLPANNLLTSPLKQSVTPPTPDLSQNPIQEMGCPVCGYQGTPEFEDFDETTIRITGYETEARTRELITVWGPLNVKIPGWVRRLSDSPYLILETDEHYARCQSIYEELFNEIQPQADRENYSSTLRAPTNYEGTTPDDLCCVRRCWLRPWAFNVLGNRDVDDPEDKIGRLKSMFPKGVYVVVINDDIIAEAVGDSLDEHWTITENPLSDTVHAEPLGAPLVPIQEMTNELANLTLESIEHQIPETYADSDVIDWDAYRKSEARPGMLYPATKKTGERLGDSFYEVKGSSLSREIDVFSTKLEQVAQFVIGSLPSVFGGQIEGGSGTAREYEMSRAQALQRLSTTWRLITVWWTQVTSKAVKSFANNMVGDEKIVSNKGGTSSFINTWIRQAQMRGKVGNAYSEAAETLPINWNQKKDVLMNLMNMKDPIIGGVLSHPENASFVARVIGVPELYIPGDDDRNKQLGEIALLIQGQPEQIPAPLPTGPDGQPIPPEAAPPVDPNMPPPMIERSSVPIEPDLDDHQIESIVCGAWLKSEVGQEMKRSNPAAYYNVLLHKKEHDQVIQERMMQQAMMQAQMGQGGEEGPEKSEEEIAPING